MEIEVECMICHLLRYSYLCEFRASSPRAGVGTIDGALWLQLCSLSFRLLAGEIPLCPLEVPPPPEVVLHRSPG